MTRKRFNPDRDVAEWTGPKVRYDLLKEVAICFVVVLVLVTGLAVVFSSPDEPPITLKSWSRAAPVDFVRTAITELDGTSGTAAYGPPYTSTPDVAQKIGPISLAQVSGVRIPLDTAMDFVIAPLLTLPSAPVLDVAIAEYEHASTTVQQRWDANFTTAASAPSFRGSLGLPKAADGPVGTMMVRLLSMARSGALDGALLATPQLYGTDYTKPLLFLADGAYMGDLAVNRNLDGGQWGMMNETGNFPGQAWLWLYTLWYQVPPFSTSGNGDALIWGIMMLLTLLLALVPFIPGLRSIPRWTRVYRLIWHRHYRST